MAEQIAPPVLSTPDTHIFEDPTPPVTSQNSLKLSDEEIYEVYEIERTARELKEGGWRRIALQFPDAMLGDAIKVFESLEKILRNLDRKDESSRKVGMEKNCNKFPIADNEARNLAQDLDQNIEEKKRSITQERLRLFILADTSYGSCCVDEIAAEHVDAEVVVHYGRSCLSPTARLPVIYVFTFYPLSVEEVTTTFEKQFINKEEQVVLMADISYASHIRTIQDKLVGKGYTNVVAPEVIHDPSSPIPNRSLPEEFKLKDYTLFHISDPPPALLLTLSSRVKDMFIYPTTSPMSAETRAQAAIQTNTSTALRRRYALLTRLSSCGIFGILINTLSVKNYLSTVDSIRSMIQESGKKSYTFVVGKVNAAKIANFSEIGGWVVVGCWESSLIESTEFYNPIITPFELKLALQSDDSRIWTGEWRGDFPSLDVENGQNIANEEQPKINEASTEQSQFDLHEGSEDESAPPEYDLRTGRYISNSRPMRNTQSTRISHQTVGVETAATASKVLTMRAKGDIATVNGAVSPGAEYLRNQRTWAGLGSDFTGDASTTIEEGRSGVARGYTVGENGEQR